MNLYEMSATKLSKMIKAKKISALELTNSIFARINSVEPKIQSYVTLCEEDAIKTSKLVDEKISKGEETSPLAGIPIGIKDNICTKNILTTCSSKMLHNFVPPYDATVIKKLKNANAVITGKLNMDEFAMGSSTETSYFKTTKNPYNINYVPGGSSGGSAAAVAAGEAIISLGSDTGGSIRQPASYCSVVGLKPTYGAISRYGLIAFASSLDQIGPITKCVDDSALLYSIISGQDPLDATSQKVNPLNWNDSFSDISMIKGLKVAIPEEYFSDQIDDDIKEAVFNVIKMLEKNGAKISKISLPSTPHALSAYYIISSAEASSNLARYDGVHYGYRSENHSTLTEMYENTRTEGFGTEVKTRIMLGTYILSSGYYDTYYKRAKLLQTKIISEFKETFKEYDIILTPTVPTPPFPIGAEINDSAKMHSNDMNTVSSNISGVPAISLPCCLNKDSLPIGVQLMCNHFEEEKLFKIAKCCELLIGDIKLPNI